MEYAVADVRYGFTAQYLMASAIFVRHAAAIEAEHPAEADEATRTEHKGLVTAAIMQSVAAVESESAELTMHGPGSHLGSNGEDHEVHKFLLPLAQLIDSQSTLTRYSLILHLLRKEPFDEGKQPWQDTNLLVRLRNELVHYKSFWGRQMDDRKFLASLKALRLRKPPFVSPHTNFFPHQLLSADCAAWSVQTAVAFISAFYERMKIRSSLEPFMERIGQL